MPAIPIPYKLLVHGHTKDPEFHLPFLHTLLLPQSSFQFSSIRRLQSQFAEHLCSQEDVQER